MPTHASSIGMKCQKLLLMLQRIKNNGSAEVASTILVVLLNEVNRNKAMFLLFMVPKEEKQLSNPVSD
jgi:hypothetical protein